MNIIKDYIPQSLDINYSIADEQMSHFNFDGDVIYVISPRFDIDPKTGALINRDEKRKAMQIEKKSDDEFQVEIINYVTDPLQVKSIQVGELEVTLEKSNRLLTKKPDKEELFSFFCSSMQHCFDSASSRNETCYIYLNNFVIRKAYTQSNDNYYAVDVNLENYTCRMRHTFVKIN